MTAGGGSPITGPASVSTVSLPSIQATGVAVGQTFVVDVFAEPASLEATFLSWVVSPLTLPFGDLWVSPLSPVMDFATMPASGHRTVSLVVPAIPSALPIVLQTIALTTGGRLAFGVPTAVVMN